MRPLGSYIPIVVDHSNELPQLLSFGWSFQSEYGIYFFGTGLIPFLVIQYPKYSSSAVQSELLDTMIFYPASASLVRACSSCSRCSSKVPLEMMSKSSR